MQSPPIASGWEQHSKWAPVPRERTSGESSGGGSSRDHVQSRVSGQSRLEDWSGMSRSEWNEESPHGAVDLVLALDARAVRPCDRKDLDNLSYETRVSELLEDQATNRYILEVVRQTINGSNLQHPITKESKVLSYIGRHCPEAPRIGTYVPVAYIRNTHRHAFRDPLQLAACILFNEKNRFTTKILNVDAGRRVFIACTQGHGHGITMDRADVQTRVSEHNIPGLAVHGTVWPAFHKISKEGLLPGGPQRLRQDVHFATSLPGEGEIMSGLRRRSEVHIFLDVEKFVRDGHVCYLTMNRVLVTPERVDPRYFKYVTDSTDPSVDILSNTSVPPEYRISCGMTVREDAHYQVPRFSSSPERPSSSAAADSRERASASAIDQEIEPALEIEERIPTGDTEDEAEREEAERLAAIQLNMIDSVKKFFNGEPITDLEFDIISMVAEEKMIEMGMGDRYEELKDLIREKRVIREATEMSQETEIAAAPRERTGEQPPRAKSAFTDIRLKDGRSAEIPDFVSMVGEASGSAGAADSRERASAKQPAAEAKPKMLQPPPIPMPKRPVPRPEATTVQPAGPPPAQELAKAKSKFAMTSEFVTPKPTMPTSHVPPELHQSQIKAKLRDEKHEEEGLDPRMPGPDEDEEMPETENRGRYRSKSRTRSRVREHSDMGPEAPPLDENRTFRKDPVMYQIKKISGSGRRVQKDLEDWYRYFHHQLPQADKKRTEEVVRTTAANTLQLSVAFFNMGNLTRPPRFAGRVLGPEYSMISDLVINNYAHVVAVAESEGLHEPVNLDKIRVSGRVLGSNRQKDLSVLVTGAPEDVTIDLRMDLRSGDLRFAIFVISFGYEQEAVPVSGTVVVMEDITSDVRVTSEPRVADNFGGFRVSGHDQPERPVTLPLRRAGLTCVVVCVYHVHNDAKYRLEKSPKGVGRHVPGRGRLPR